MHRTDDRRMLRAGTWHGVRTAGVEPTLVSLAAVLDEEPLEIACENARRRSLTSMCALETYLHLAPHRRGTATLHSLLTQLHPVYASRSTLAVKTRRLLIARGLTGFTREFPLDWNGRRYYFDFCFNANRTILEANGQAWHDDPLDYEYDNEKWSVPGRYNYKLVFATRKKVTQRPGTLIAELGATLAA